MTTTTLAIGAVVAHRYEIREQLAERPAYVEYRAFDLDVEVEVAVWWMRRELLPSQEACTSLIGSISRMRELRHANVRRLFDAGWEGDGIYVTAQIASFDRVVPRVPTGAILDSADLLHFATSIIDGLSAAHLNKRIHGRLIPSDIVHVARLIKVSGLGLYSGIERYAAGQLWQPYSQYLAPEVLAGQAATIQADVFGAARIIGEVAGGLDAIAAEIPELASVLADACAEDPALRTASVEVLLERLRTVLVDGRVPTAERAAITPPPELAPEMLIPPPLDMASLHSDEFDELAEERNRMVTRPLRKLPPNFDEAVETILEGKMITGAPPPPATASPGAPPLAPAPLAPAPPEVPVRPRKSLQFKSMKPPSEQGAKPTPPMSAVDRPDMKPRIRAISSVVEEIPSQLGNYAPPRKIPAPQRRPLWVYAAVLAGAIVLGLLAVLLIAKLTSKDASDNRSGQLVVDAGSATASPIRPQVTANPVVRSDDAGVVLRCAKGMALVRVAEPYCIDSYESPGRGRFPVAGVTLAQAQQSCGRRGARLCSEPEWVAACRGRRGASFPYGSSFLPRLCNTKGTIRATGSFVRCVSAVGAYDMSGNVAEWVQGGIVKGGSFKDSSNGRCSARQLLPGRGAQGFGDVGFRCCAAAVR